MSMRFMFQICLQMRFILNNNQFEYKDENIIIMPESYLN